MIYILTQVKVGDLYCQKTLVEQFSYTAIREQDSNLGKFFQDFTFSIDFLSNMDGNLLSRVDLKDKKEYLVAF